MRNISIIALFLGFVLTFVTLEAQTVSSYGFNAGGVTVQNVSVVLGQPFDAIATQNGYEMSEGVNQAQLVTVTLADETCVNEPYAENGFDIPVSDLSEGTTTYDSYAHNATAFGGYDSLTVLELTVWPVYSVTSSEVFHGDLPVIDGSKLKDGADYQIVEGENVINYLSVHGCDSVVTLYVSGCPLSVSDGDGNSYNTVVLAGYCWTQSNLRATHYADGTTPIAKSLVYNPLPLADETSTANTYGRLYTWYSAVNLPEGSDDAPTPDANGYVQGICPNGWHILTSTEMAALLTQSAPTVRSTTLWVGPHADENTNSTGFTAVPAGEYNSALNRYESLGTQTDWWSVIHSHSTTTHTTLAHVITCAYYCEGLLENIYTADDAVSVRCVKNP
jgi:uncharacterized protein (TIGR02145 family)